MCCAISRLGSSIASCKWTIFSASCMDGDNEKKLSNFLKKTSMFPPILNIGIFGLVVADMAGMCVAGAVAASKLRGGVAAPPAAAPLSVIVGSGRDGTVEWLRAASLFMASSNLTCRVSNCRLILSISRCLLSSSEAASSNSLVVSRALSASDSGSITLVHGTNVMMGMCMVTGTARYTYVISIW